jgi:glycosyltransferase involved in cell wall biosynthesis
MKKVLIFSLAYYPKHVGGAEIAVKEITDRIASSEIEFHVVTNRYDSTLSSVEKMGNVLVHRIGLTKHEPSMSDLKKFPLHLNKLLYQFTAFFKAISLHKKYHYDAIWAMMAHSCAVPAGLFKTFYPKVPYLLTLQEGDPPEYIEKKMRILWPLFVRGFTTADYLQSISTFLSVWGKKMGFKGVLKIIPNAVNTAHFSQEYSDGELAATKQVLGKKDGEIFLVTTSRLVKKNAVDDVIRALSVLPEHIRFIVFGLGPDDEMLKKLAKELNVENRVQFRGQIGHAEMPKYIKACDIFIRPSRSEGMGNSFVEAMAAELPVIATQEGGIADFLFDAKRNPDKQTTGWAVDKDAPVQIASAVKDILEDKTKTAEVVRNAKRMAFEKYDWNTIAQAMKSLFAELLASRI